MRMYIFILTYNYQILLKSKISTNKSLYGLIYDIPLQINKNDNNEYINFMVRKDGLSDIEINKKFYEFINMLDLMIIEIIR